MNVNLAGKTAFVTGGNIGIGRAVSLALARCGADVALTYYSHEIEGKETVAAIQKMGRNSTALQLDATSSEQVKDVVKQVAQALGGHVDILMNNAGHLVGRSSIADMTDEHWFKTINVNLTSTFFCTRAVLPFMNTGWGRIINMSSLAARNGGGNGDKGVKDLRQRMSERRQNRRNGGNGKDKSKRNGDGNGKALNSQISAILNLAKGRDISNRDLEEMLMKRFESNLDHLSGEDAGVFISEIQQVN